MEGSLYQDAVNLNTCHCNQTCSLVSNVEMWPAVPNVKQCRNRAGTVNVANVKAKSLAMVLSQFYPPAVLIIHNWLFIRPSRSSEWSSPRYFFSRILYECPQSYLRAQPMDELVNCRPCRFVSKLISRNVLLLRGVPATGGFDTRAQ
jgi:hypothetical protein